MSKHCKQQRVDTRVVWGMHLWGLGQFPTRLITECSGHIQPLQPQQLASFFLLLLTKDNLFSIFWKNTTASRSDTDANN